MIFDKVRILNKDNSKIERELVEILNQKFIKIMCNDDLITERDILEITIEKENLYIENERITLDELINKYNLVANIFTNEQNDYIKNYSKMVLNRKKYVSSLITKNKYYNNFDKVIGALYFSDEEYYTLEDTKLKQFIFSKTGESFKYVIPNESGLLLRGADTYYYLFANKGKFEHVIFNRFESLYKNYTNYFKNIKKIINENDNKILVLSVLDNIRNYILIIINMYSIRNQIGDETILMEFDNQELMDIIYNTYNQMVLILEQDIFDCEKIIRIIDSVINLNYLNDVKNTNKELYDKMLKSHRECDSFLENYICIKDYYLNNKNEKYYLSALYGGIEIPLIFYYLTKRSSYVYYISLFGIYKERHKSHFDYNDSRFNINKYIKHDVNAFVLCDDNMMTGKTIQYIIDSLCLNDFNVKCLLLINYVALNRIYQVLDNLTLMDLDLIDKYIFGLYYPTKYSKIKFDKNIKGTYLDEFNIFDLSKEYICYYLFKNGIYAEESRINNYRIGGDNR